MAWVQIAAATLSANSLRQTVHTRRASVHQAAKLVAALLRVAKLQAWRKVMAAYRRVYDSRHLQVDCQEPGSAQEPYARDNRVWTTFLDGSRFLRGMGTLRATYTRLLLQNGLLVPSFVQDRT